MPAQFGPFAEEASASSYLREKSKLSLSKQ